MKKLYIGNKQLKSNFKMFRVKCSPENIEDTKEEIMDRMSSYLADHDGKLINVKEIKKTAELCFYFITGEQGKHDDWETFMKNQLLKDYTIIPSVIEFGPA